MKHSVLRSHRSRYAAVAPTKISITQLQVAAEIPSGKLWMWVTGRPRGAESVSKVCTVCKGLTGEQEI